jgi:serine/threonine protein phosphatase 1
VFLGDVIDRGPHSKDCLDLVDRELRRNPASTLIRGNHEDLMLRFVDGGSAGSKSWCHNGGLTTVASYGYKGFDYMDADGYVRLRDELAETFRGGHRSHVDLLRAAVPFVELPRHILVHAGIVPGIPMDEQDPYQLAWNSTTLCAYTAPLPKIVVHGHMVTAKAFPEIHINRINLDCGAYVNGVLCAALLSETSPLRFIYSIDADGALEVVESEYASDMRAAC